MRKLEFLQTVNRNEFPRRLKPAAFDGFTARLKARPPRGRCFDTYLTTGAIRKHTGAVDLEVRLKRQVILVICMKKKPAKKKVAAKKEERRASGEACGGEEGAHPIQKGFRAEGFRSEGSCASSGRGKAQLQPRHDLRERCGARDELLSRLAGIQADRGFSL